MTQLPHSNSLEAHFKPVFSDIRERSCVTDNMLDRALYQVYVATLWSNVVLSPEEVGLEEEDLEDLHDLLIEELAANIGPTTLQDVFAFINSKSGELAMNQARLTQSHKDLLLYFASMILDPEGHKRFTDHIRAKQSD